MSAPVKTARWTATAVSAVYAGVLFLSGIRLQGEVKQGLAYLPALLGLLVVALDKWLWKLPPVHRFLSRPRIDGLWATTLRPTPESQIPVGGNRGPINAYVVIEQSLWSSHISLYTSESASRSLASTIREHKDSAHSTLTFSYENTPQQQHRSRSPRHVGACELSIGTKAPLSLSGYYFTDRFTKGDMELTLLSRKTDLGDYTAAKAYADSLP
jgi:hypothetical protein